MPEQVHGVASNVASMPLRYSETGTSARTVTALQVSGGNQWAVSRKWVSDSFFRWGVL